MNKAPSKTLTRSPRKVESLPRLPVQIFLFSLTILIIGITCATLFFYSVFSRMVEAKLKEGLQHYTAEIYARPYSIIPGRRLTQKQLIQRLERLGYTRSVSRIPATYREGPIGLEFISRQGRTVDVIFSDSGVKSINVERQPTGEFGLEPELISNLSDGSGKKRKYVSYENISDVLIKAILAAEDKRFFDHVGIDFWRILKAAIIDIRSKELAQGGSTLTQQCVKNLFLTQEKRLQRKFQEICLSLILETRLTKRQIFELYVNEVYLGQEGPFSITGFGQAAAMYFHKNIRDVSLAEAACLAGIISAPNRFNPYRYPDRALKQRNQVLDAMELNGFITFAQKVAAKTVPVALQPAITYNYLEAPYFVDYVESQLVPRFSREDLYKRNYRIYTTLDAELQRAAYEAVQQGAAEIDKLLAKRKDAGNAQVALVALDPKTGEILAMIGGRNFGQSQYNRITMARRQPGSAFKPFVYAAALETPFTDTARKVTPARIYQDEPSTFYFGNTTYSPRNFGDKYLGRVNVREALMHSLNVATMHLAQEIGYQQIVTVARRAGFRGNLKPYPSVALGAFEVTPLEIAQAYTIFPNQGILRRGHAIHHIETNTGTHRQTSPPPEEVIHPETAYLVTSLMQSVLDQGTGSGARQRGFSLPAAGKTGTSNDGWFVGFTPDLLCVTWVGFDDNRDINMVGSGSALPIWTEFMKRAEHELPLRGADFEKPPNVVTVNIDPSTGLLASPRCLKVRRENFISGTEPTLQCPENMRGKFPASWTNAAGR
ncbi:MAG: PBP1A family penicillin-binding protein [Acidobacteria bacterium]|nr:PBP1A family penicillin-binding protein [Acidobacteriota bacterium]